jgi:hypothetical protein
MDQGESQNDKGQKANEPRARRSPDQIGQQEERYRNFKGTHNDPFVWSILIAKIVDYLYLRDYNRIVFTLIVVSIE